MRTNEKVKVRIPASFNSGHHLKKSELIQLLSFRLSYIFQSVLLQF